MIILYFDFKLFLLPPMHTFIQICPVIVTENVVVHQKYFLLINKTDLVNLLLETYTCQLFFSKMWDFSSPQNLNFWRFTNSFRLFPKISKEFWRSPRIFDNFRRLSKIFRRLPKLTEDVERFLTTSKQGQHFSKDFHPISSIIKEFRRCSDDFSNIKKKWIFI